MDRKTLDYLMNRVDSRRGRRDMRDYEDGRRGRRDRRDMRDHEDSRRGRGDVDFEGTMDFNDDRDMRDYGNPRLSKTDMHYWKQMMENEDGTRGPHYDMRQIMDVAEKMSIDFDKEEFDEKEFCMAINMMYSDYCKVAKKYISPDRELMFFAELAEAFLNDEDGPGASEKLALYFHCIVDA